MVDKEKKRVADRAWYLKNKDRKRAYDKEYIAKNRQRVTSRNKSYYEKNKARILAQMRQYRAKNRDRIRAKVNAYAEEHREEKREYDRLNRVNNPEKFREKDLATHRRRKNAAGKYRIWQWDAISRYYAPESVCLCCGSIKKMTMDHVIPLIAGGENCAFNLQPICLKCNFRKNKHHSTDYRPDKGAYAEFITAVAEWT